MIKALINNPILAISITLQNGCLLSHAEQTANVMKVMKNTFVNVENLINLTSLIKGKISENNQMQPITIKRLISYSLSMATKWPNFPANTVPSKKKHPRKMNTPIE
ncbi:hypothetical protein ACWXWU_09870 [Shewanella sp. A14]